VRLPEPFALGGANYPTKPRGLVGKQPGGSRATPPWDIALHLQYDYQRKDVQDVLHDELEILGKH
jgi:hypothetical protein